MFCVKHPNPNHNSIRLGLDGNRYRDLPHQGRLSRSRDALHDAWVLVLSQPVLTRSASCDVLLSHADPFRARALVRVKMWQGKQGVLRGSIG